MKFAKILIGLVSLLFWFNLGAEPVDKNVYPVCKKKPVDTKPSFKTGDKAPDFNLAAISGERGSLSYYLGQKNVVISFIPAAWTPVCSVQWPEYNKFESVFEDHDAVLLGISVDSVPTLYSWTEDLGGVWFEVLSDFWPHGQVAKEYGVLRSEGTAERALFIIDQQGIIRYIDVHDINEKPVFADLVVELQKLNDQ